MKNQTDMFKPKFKVKQGDSVKVIAGDDKGKQGRVVSILTAKSRVIVEGINMISKHTKPNAKNPNGGIIKKEAGIHISNVALVEAKAEKKEGAKKSEKAPKAASTKKTKKSGEEGK